MKNIHLIATEEPSRLGRFVDTDNLFLRTPNDLPRGENVNVYITSDEEITKETKPCWCINTIKNTWNDDLVYYQGAMPQYHFIGFKKIILTTDQDLIKDGVQAIDDEFLKWFVKNPSCEFVEVKHKDIIQYGNMTMHDHNGDGSYYFCTNCEVEVSRSKEELLKFGVEYYKIIIPSVKPKQETLEEAAEDFYEENAHDITFLKLVEFGAKWQQERMYSEEDMQEYANYCIRDYQKKIPYKAVKEWFEKFKQK